MPAPVTDVGGLSSGSSSVLIMRAFEVVTSDCRLITPGGGRGLGESVRAGSGEGSSPVSWDRSLDVN